jgi:hypothetical protein
LRRQGAGSQSASCGVWLRAPDRVRDESDGYELTEPGRVAGETGICSRTTSGNQPLVSQGDSNPQFRNSSMCRACSRPNTSGLAGRRRDQPDFTQESITGEGTAGPVRSRTHDSLAIVIGRRPGKST